jgi:hypothetical protein
MTRDSAARVKPAVRRSAAWREGETQRVWPKVPCRRREVRVARMKRPPGRRTRWISARARCGSRYQWYEIVEVRRSTEASARGRA